MCHFSHKGALLILLPMTVLPTSRPLSVGSYLQITWWALGQWKERKNASNHNNSYILLFSTRVKGHIILQSFPKRTKRRLINVYSYTILQKTISPYLWAGSFTGLFIFQFMRWRVVPSTLNITVTVIHVVAPWAYCFKNIKFLQGNYQPIVPQQKHFSVSLCMITIACYSSPLNFFR